MLDADFFERIPTSPGVYLMKDRAGRVIYVGKAKNLRSRVRQYFRPGGDPRFFVAAGLLGRAIADLETVVVGNEKEALLLENHLIKQHQPRFNVNLRDDKQYLVLRIDQRQPFPRVDVVRNIADDGARYFGPYHSATSCRQTLSTLNRHFQLRTCTDHVLGSRTRPCLQYQIKRCPGPCVFPVDATAYREQVEDVALFLAGKNDALVARLRARMVAAAAAEAFEAAAQLRDSIGAVERSLARQDVVQDSFVDQDVFGLWREADVVELVVLFVRGGKLMGRRSFRQRDQEVADAEVMADFVQQYYDTGTLIPDEVVVAVDFEARPLVADWLTGKRGRKVAVLAPRRGTRTRLVALANKNAAASAASRRTRDQDAMAGLDKLQRRLSLKRFPHRIECYDIAHIQGASTVAAMVVFTDGVPDRGRYRKFRVKTVQNDDFAAMYEVLTRRFRRALAAEAAGGQDDPWAPPDLVVVDGGKGQLGTALAVLADLGIEITASKGFDVIALAKERPVAGGASRTGKAIPAGEASRAAEASLTGEAVPDRVFLRNAKDPIRLRPNTTELYLLSRVRDEAHRFANTFHRQRRSRATLRSSLDEIPGIGATRRRQLLRHLGSLRAIRAASVEAIAAVPGMNRKAAEAVRRFFDQSSE